MAEYNFKEIEQKWQRIWAEKKTFTSDFPSTKPKYYVLDMFPYPSGAGLHVGHPLGYIASDIVARYKRHKGYNVLHPMGFDSFGLPAEQYAVQTGQHPAITTAKNIERYKEQLAKIGFSYDWDKEVWTSKPDYYRWTQWIFIQLFHSWYNQKTNKAESIDTLIQTFEKEGNTSIKAAQDEDTPVFSSETWKAFTETQQQEILLKYRLTYLADTMVNWCPGLGTVLANEEVINGVSERGGFPVERKKMKQWMMRITAYADRLLQGLDVLDWPEPMKEMQRNWIGKSYGAELQFQVVGKSITLTVFTTRVDTTFGVTYLSIAPEGEWVSQLTSPEQKEAVEAYVLAAKNRSERDRMSDVKTVSGVFTGSYAINPFNNEQVPIWIADYVLAGYGTGVVMAVPSSDERDFRFANHYDLPIIPVQEGPKTDITKEDFDPKAGTMINSGFLNGLAVPEAIKKAIAFVEEKGIGKSKVQYRQRDAIFARQRYWGEPIPIYFKDGLPYTMDESDLPLELPQIDEYKPTETGEPPLGRAKDFTYKGYPLELSTMPGWAGSSWYFLRYMDAQNATRFADTETEKYWNQVDLYLGGSEHATGHLLYSRFWNLFLYDRGYVTSPEPFKKLINQGMIMGVSYFIPYYTGNISTDGNLSEPVLKPNIKILTSPKNLSNPHLNDFEGKKVIVEETKRRIPSEYVDAHGKLYKEKYLEFIQTDLFKSYELNPTEYIEKWEVDSNGLEYIEPFSEVEKMSKSKHNVVNPDDVVAKYGADTLRLFEMFLGPLEQQKPWSTASIDGCLRFLRKLWRLFYDETGKWIVTNEKPTPGEYKSLHKTIKKVEEDIERFSFNTSVSTFMVCVNELADQKCHKKEILEAFLVVLSPYAPHITEELWESLGNKESISKAEFPAFNPAHLVESSFEYPISVNGKVRGKLTFPADMEAKAIENEVLASDILQKWLEGTQVKKVIVVPKKIVNVVI